MYWSRSLTDAKLNYDTTQLECLAIVRAVLLLRSYLKGTQFTSRTDYYSLKCILNLTDSTKKLERWRLRLSEFDSDVVHCAGVKRQASDALFYLRATGKDDIALKDDLPLLVIDTEDDNTGILVISANSNDIFSLDAQEGKSINTHPTLEELITRQAFNEYCKAASFNFDHAESKFNLSQRGLFVQKSIVV